MDKKEAKRLYNKKYRKLNRDILLVKGAIYRENNKEKIKQSKLKYNTANRAKVRKANSDYIKTPAGKKSKSIANWKYHGIISNDWNKTYEYYINCHNCEWCDKPFKNYKNRHLDHDHNINDDVNIRGVLCISCNTRDYLGKFYAENPDVYA